MSDKNTDDATKKKGDQMKVSIILISIVLLVVILWSAGSEKYQENLNTVKLPDGWSENGSQVSAIVDVIKAYGYKCDKVNGVIGNSYRGFRVTCNDYRYIYDVKDVGGTWVVTVG